MTYTSRNSWGRREKQLALQSLLDQPVCSEHSMVCAAKLPVGCENGKANKWPRVQSRMVEQSRLPRRSQLIRQLRSLRSPTSEARLADLVASLGPNWHRFSKQFPIQGLRVPHRCQAHKLRQVYGLSTYQPQHHLRKRPVAGPLHLHPTLDRRLLNCVTSLMIHRYNSYRTIIQHIAGRKSNGQRLYRAM